MVTLRHIGRNIKLKRLVTGTIRLAVSMGTVPLIAIHDFPGLALISTESRLARSTPMGAPARQTEVLSRSGFPASYGAALVGSQEVEVAVAGEDGGAAAAVVGVGEVFVDGVGAVGVVFGAEGGRVVELHVCLDGGGEGEAQG